MFERRNVENVEQSEVDRVAETIDSGNGNLADAKYRAYNARDNAKIVAVVKVNEVIEYRRVVTTCTGVDNP